MWTFYLLVFSCKVFRAFLFLFIRSSIHSISTFFFAWRKWADLAVISNKWMEENFAAFRGNFCDKCPQAKLPLESSYLGGNSPGSKFPRVHLSLGAIAREVKIWGRQLFLDQLFSGAIVLWGNNPGAIIWGGNFRHGQLSEHHMIDVKFFIILFNSQLCYYILCFQS